MSDTEIVVGCSADLSGPLAAVGEQATRFGLDLRFKVVNEDGGIHGRRVRTVYYDDGSRAEAALANTRKLVEQDRVFAVIGPRGTAPVAAILDYLEAREVPLLFPLQGSPAIRGRTSVVGGMMLFDRQSRMMVDYLVGSRKYRRLAVAFQDDEYGRSFLGFIEKDLARHRLRPAAVEPLAWGATDVSASMTRLRAARPEVLVLVLTPGLAVQVIKERHTIGWTDVVLVSAGPLTDERYLGLAGPATEGVEGLALWPDPLTSDLPGIRTYREAMQKHFPGNVPNRASLAGYFAAGLFAEAARRAGRDLSRQGLLTALLSLRGFESGILPAITVGSDHETQKQGLWVRMDKGRLAPVTTWLPAE